MSREDLLSVLDSFCTAFTHRDTEAVMRLLSPDTEVLVITSEEPLLRGYDEVRCFLDSYVKGPTTYSWEWERHDVSVVGRLGWLLAEGTETATTEDQRETHPYRMTMVCESREGRWMLRQVHGSSPQHG
jgi:ketosteroid isomerase-like protein